MGAAALFLFGAGAFFIFSACIFDKTMPGKVYDSDSLGISFRYPETYFLEEKNLGDGHRARHAVILSEDTEENRLVREGKAPGREGPITITLEIFQNLEGYDLREWIEGTAFSNWKLSDGVKKDVEIGGAPAISYRWSGLYEAESIVFKNRDYIAMLSVAYITRDDVTYRDFPVILNTFVLY